MDAVTAPNPAPTEAPEATEEVELKELSPAELKDLVESESAQSNPQLISGLLTDVLGASVGFVLAGYANQYLLSQALAGQTGAAAMQSALLYSAGLLVGEFVLAALVLFYARKHARRMKEIVESFALGVVLAGVGSFASEVLAYMGQPGVALPAVDLKGGAIRSTQQKGAVGV